MIELLVGFMLGGLAFTEKGHEIGNKIYNAGVSAVKKAAKEAKKDEDDTETIKHD